MIGWEAYEACRESGAIIATAHVHLYARSHLIAAFRDPPLVASRDDPVRIGSGSTFAFVSGLGGESAARLHRPPTTLMGRLKFFVGGGDMPTLDPWWAAVHAHEQGANAGALFCTFNPGDQKDRADCFFKDIRGSVKDRFSIINAVGRR
jgi:hypothetical protein